MPRACDESTLFAIDSEPPRLDGVPRLLAYQRQGRVTQGRAALGWRLLDVSKIRRCDVLEETFEGSRGDFHEDHYSWDVLYARVT